jgi:hypothetical protein
MSDNTSESNSNTQIAKFDGNNFAMWKMRASALLMTKGWLEVVINHVKGSNCKSINCQENSGVNSGRGKSGNSTHSSVINLGRDDNDIIDGNGESTGSSAPVAADSNTERKEDNNSSTSVSEIIEEKKRKAYGLLVLCLGVEQLRMIQQIEGGDAHGVWCTLIDNYERKSMESQIQLFDQLFGLKMKSGEKITVFVSRLLEIEVKLKQYKEYISDRMLLCVLLRGVPNSYMSLVQLLKMNENVKFEQAIEQLRNEEERQLTNGKETMKSTEVETAYAASHEERRLKCWTCNKEGHSKFNCPNNKDKSKCQYCKKIGHNEDNCWNKDKGRRIISSHKRNEGAHNTETDQI